MSPKPAPKIVRGSFGPKGDGVGFVLLNGNLFIETLVIQRERVEPGIFLLDMRGIGKHHLA